MRIVPLALLAAALLAAQPAAAAKPPPRPTPEGMVAVDPLGPAFDTALGGTYVRLGVINPGSGLSEQYVMIPPPAEPGQPAQSWLIQVNGQGQGLVFAPLQFDCAARQARYGRDTWMEDDRRQAFAAANQPDAWGPWAAAGSPSVTQRMMTIGCRALPATTRMLAGWKAVRADGWRQIRQAGGSAPIAQVTLPDWIEKPGPEDLARFYPPLAARAQVGATVKLSCLVAVNGRLEDCLPVSETVAGLGFSDAALKMAGKFRMKPLTLDGKPVAGALVVIPVIFTVPQG